MRDAIPHRVVNQAARRRAVAGDYHLADGRTVTIRRVVAGDKPLLQAAVKALSATSRYLRFMGLKQCLSRAELVYFTEVDQENHLAWIATEAAADGRALGVARCVRLPGEPEVAEAAVTVIDAEQGRGLGSLLCEILAADAIDHGIATIRAHVVAGNARMLHICQHRGGVHRASDGNEVTFEIQLAGALEPAPGWARSA